MNKAVKILHEKALQGDANAQFLLGKNYSIGEGVSENKEKAIEWYRRAAEQGDSEHQMALGLALCWDGEALSSNFTEGFNWILKAAERGHLGAQYFVAAQYATGENIQRDPYKAVEWYQRLAEVGHPEAQYNLAIMYLEADGICQDIEEFKRWLTRSAENGEILAKQFIEKIYRQGLYGFTRDNEKADAWLRRIS